MSLAVSVFVRDPISKEIVSDEFLENFTAGPEVWRTLVWGASSVVAAGANYLPQLANSDLWVECDELQEFSEECEMLGAKLAELFPQAAVDGTLISIRQRLEIIAEATEYAMQQGAGVSIQ